MACPSVSLLRHLKSIIFDADYVRRSAHDLKLPVVGNQRCGSWYVPPDLLADSCYFKSTDGHVDKWAFNYRRLNFHLLPLIETNGGCIIVDSTKGDKRFSDASSKTIPIWCAVLNRLLFPLHSELHNVVLPSLDVVAESEAGAIRNLLSSLQHDASQLGLDISLLRSQITRPLLPRFLEPPSTCLDLSSGTGCHSVVILMASSNQARFNQPGKYSPPFQGYIRGAGDDEDNWSHSITPSDFWANPHAMTASLEDPEVDFYEAIYVAARPTPRMSLLKPTQVGQTGIDIAAQLPPPSMKSLRIRQSYDAIIACALTPHEDDDVSNPGDATPLLKLNLPHGKLGSRALRMALGRVVTFISTVHIAVPKILITDKNGTDLAIGVALAVSCLFYQTSRFDSSPVVAAMSKDMIRKHLAIISTSKSDANPSRTTLQSVHAFLMPEHGLEGLRREIGSLTNKDTAARGD